MRQSFEMDKILEIRGEKSAAFSYQSKYRFTPSVIVCYEFDSDRYSQHLYCQLNNNLRFPGKCISEYLHCVVLAAAKGLSFFFGVWKLQWDRCDKWWS